MQCLVKPGVKYTIAGSAQVVTSRAGSATSEVQNALICIARCEAQLTLVYTAVTMGRAGSARSEVSLQYC
jgi:hypothetical protein